MKRTFGYFGIMLALFCLASGAQAQQGRRFVTLDFPGFFSFTCPIGINNQGDVAGLYDDANGVWHGYVRIRGKFEKVDYPNSRLTVCCGITDLGVASGTYIDQKGFQHGFLWEAGRFRRLDVPFASQTQGIGYEFGPGLGTASFGLNLFENVTGQYADAAGTSHGWVLANGRYYTVDAPGAGVGPGLGTLVFVINLWGDLVGSYHTAAPPFYVHGWTKFCGFFIPIEMPGAAGDFGTQANGINDLGDIVGVYTDAQDYLHGMLVHNGRYIAIDYPGAIASECHAINDFGDLTGQYYSADGKAHGFVMTNR